MIAVRGFREAIPWRAIPGKAADPVFNVRVLAEARSIRFR
jgi:hypothetical protein